MTTLYSSHCSLSVQTYELIIIHMIFSTVLEPVTLRTKAPETTLGNDILCSSTLFLLLIVNPFHHHHNHIITSFIRRSDHPLLFFNFIFLFIKSIEDSKKKLPVGFKRKAWTEYLSTM
ncbi:hypothetical protein Cadr_000000896 [Camelus dromedarius]|nr:hypothetical protein Cadr_000000896 [Camelus dromedarius]